MKPQCVAAACQLAAYLHFFWQLLNFFFVPSALLFFPRV